MRALAAATAALAVGLAACGDDGGDTKAPARGGPSYVRTVSRDAHIGRGGHDVRLLTVRGMGKVLVSCDDEGRSSAAFRAAFRTASADVVVQRGAETAEGRVDPEERFAPSLAPATKGIEHWQIAEFSKAQATVTTITVAMQQIGAGATLECAISAQATASQTAAGTLTR